MDRKVRMIMVGLFCILGLTLLAQAPASAQAIAGKEIRLGAALCVSGHGANVGKREAIGAQAAVDVINAAGTIKGVSLKLYVEDTASNPQEAVNVVRKLTADQKVLAIIGPHYSSEAEATFPLGNQLKIVQICVASSKPGLSAANRPYAFRNTLTEDKIADAVAREFKKRYNIKKIAIITDIKDAVSKSVGTQVLPQAYKANGIEIITGSDPVTFQTNDTQFTAQITKLKAMSRHGSPRPGRPQYRHRSPAAGDGPALHEYGPNHGREYGRNRRQGRGRNFFRDHLASQRRYTREPEVHRCLQETTEDHVYQPVHGDSGLLSRERL